ncbi:hypothetical protein RM543_05430 [Roseicyclus sp. F158]|uniref:PepSY domain-containing protein n=1 Tax=Tropicimonas omnivorans TaxID=3075590 RepID=A0ABU3DEH0_9RHOB|nr:hypothetical protein [Roseicyclus sp. F158]MDT0682117.1 hypothetical protein [Roseicyclus sp. F158]
MYKAAALTAAALISGSATFAQTMPAELESRLEAEGYTEVEMHEGENGQITVDAMRNGEVVRLFFDAGAGAGDEAPEQSGTDAAFGKNGPGDEPEDESGDQED